MNTAQIARWCNEIESIILEIYNTKRMMQFDECKKMLSKLKAIGAELSEKPKTNADRIRQMTDEELFDFLDAITDTCGCWSPQCDNCPMKYKDTSPQCDIQAWLKQEVSEDASD